MVLSGGPATEMFICRTSVGGPNSLAFTLTPSTHDGVVYLQIRVYRHRLRPFSPATLWVESGVPVVLAPSGESAVAVTSSEAGDAITNSDSTTFPWWPSGPATPTVAIRCNESKFRHPTELVFTVMSLDSVEVPSSTSSYVDIELCWWALKRKPAEGRALSSDDSLSSTAPHKRSRKEIAEGDNTGTVPAADTSGKLRSSKAEKSPTTLALETPPSGMNSPLTGSKVDDGSIVTQRTDSLSAPAPAINAMSASVTDGALVSSAWSPADVTPDAQSNQKLLSSAPIRKRLNEPYRPLALRGPDTSLHIPAYRPAACAAATSIVAPDLVAGGPVASDVSSVNGDLLRESPPTDFGSRCSSHARPADSLTSPQQIPFSTSNGHRLRGNWLHRLAVSMLEYEEQAPIAVVEPSRSDLASAPHRLDVFSPMFFSGLDEKGACSISTAKSTVPPSCSLLDVSAEPSLDAVQMLLESPEVSGAVRKTSWRYGATGFPMTFLDLACEQPARAAHPHITTVLRAQAEQACIMSNLPVPAVEVGHYEGGTESSATGPRTLSISPYALPCWERLSLHPRRETLLLRYLVIGPEIDGIKKATRAYLRELGAMYSACNLGKHVEYSLDEVAADPATASDATVGGMAVAYRKKCFELGQLLLRRASEGAAEHDLELQQAGVNSAIVLHVLDPERTNALSSEADPYGCLPAVAEGLGCSSVGNRLRRKLIINMVPRYEISGIHNRQGRCRPLLGRLKATAFSLFAKASTKATLGCAESAPDLPAANVQGPLYALAQRTSVGKWKAEGAQLVQETPEHILHVAYCTGAANFPGHAVFADANGDVVESVELPQGRAMADAVALVWGAATRIAKASARRCRLVVCRRSPVAASELECWSSIFESVAANDGPAGEMSGTAFVCITEPSAFRMFRPAGSPANARPPGLGRTVSLSLEKPGPFASEWMQNSGVMPTATTLLHTPLSRSTSSETLLVGLMLRQKFLTRGSTEFHILDGPCARKAIQFIAAELDALSWLTTDMVVLSHGRQTNLPIHLVLLERLCAPPECG